MSNEKKQHDKLPTGAYVEIKVGHTLHAALDHYVDLSDEDLYVATRCHGLNLGQSLLPGLPPLVAALHKKKETEIDSNFVARLLKQLPYKSLHQLWPLQRILKYLSRSGPELRESSLVDDVLVRIEELKGATAAEPTRAAVEEALEIFGKPFKQVHGSTLCKVDKITQLDIEKKIHFMYRTKEDNWAVDPRKDVDIPLFDRDAFQTWLRVYLRLFVLHWMKLGQESRKQLIGLNVDHWTKDNQAVWKLDGVRFSENLGANIAKLQVSVGNVPVKTKIEHFKKGEISRAARQALITDRSP